MHTACNDSAEKPASFMALLPFLVFLFFYLGLSIAAKDFYRVPMIIAFLMASATALLYDRKRPLEQKVDIYARGMGDGNIMIMCLIFILAGVFAAVAKSMGSVDAAVLIARHLIPDKLIVASFFLVSCFVSLAIGTSCGTIAALTPIAAALVNEMEIAPALMIGAVIGGAMFGDNMSMISDTTIAATRTQGVAMRDKFLVNFRMISPAALIVLLIYLFSGSGNVAPAGELAPVGWKHIVNIIPYLVILIGALAGLNVMLLLFAGSLFAAVIGMVGNSLTFWSSLDVAGKGALGMAETLIVAMLSGGMLAVIRFNGGIACLLGWIGKRISGKRGCELGTLFLTGVVNLFTANNTVAIVITGPIVKDLSVKYNCDPRRIAGILDTASCAVQGLIPYGAQLLIAFGIAQSAGLKVSSLELVCASFYPMFLAVALFWNILVMPPLKKLFSKK